jgi:hypothetical protein
LRRRATPARKCQFFNNSALLIILPSEGGHGFCLRPRLASASEHCGCIQGSCTFYEVVCRRTPSKEGVQRALFRDTLFRGWTEPWADLRCVNVRMKTDGDCKLGRGPGGGRSGLRFISGRGLTQMVRFSGSGASSGLSRFFSKDADQQGASANESAVQPSLVLWGPRH